MGFDNHINKSAGVIKNPLLFRLKINNKITYLLGTNHFLPLSYFSKEVLRLIGSRDFLIEELKDPSDTEIINFKNKLSNKYLKGDKTNWSKIFNSNELYNIKKCVESCIYGLLMYKHTINIEDVTKVKLQLIIYSMTVAFQEYIFKAEIENKRNKSSVEKVLYGTRMNEELEDIFYENRTGLEEYYYDFDFSLMSDLDVDLELQDDPNMLEIKVMYDLMCFLKNGHNVKESVEMLKFIYRKDPKILKEIEKDTLNEIENIIDRYKKSAFLNDFYSAIKEDNLDKQDNNNSMKIKNNYWVSKIKNILNTTNKKPLISVDYRKLFGSNGLLKLLAEKGAKIQILDKSNQFKDFKYSFIEYERSYNHIKNQVLGNNQSYSKFFFKFSTGDKKNPESLAKFNKSKNSMALINL